jgi:thioredoxin-related protein
MKHTLVSFFLLMAVVSVKAQQVPASAKDIMREACQQAVKENKNVFVMFHASWCVWCHRMDTSMNDAACKKIFDDNYVIRHMVVDETEAKKNLETPGAAEMKTKFNGDGQGIPFWLIFDKEGNLLADSKMRKEGDAPEKGANAGCPATENEVAFFIEILKKTSSLANEQLEIIRVRFRENDK